jgi:hypothetical protein
MASGKRYGSCFSRSYDNQRRSNALGGKKIRRRIILRYGADYHGKRLRLRQTLAAVFVTPFYLPQL